MSLSLNLAKAHVYLQSQQNSQVHEQLQQHLVNDSQNMLDSSMVSTQPNGSSLNQTKFQFDIYIHKVEIISPQPIYIGVQILKGTNSLNTKKKVKVDQNIKLATFGEKLSIITQLTRQDESAGLQGYSAKLLQIRLLAFYNQKEKAIGICSIDLSQFVGSGPQKQQQKMLWSKCFDKNASFTFEVRPKEQYSTITESISEEAENSNIVDPTDSVIIAMESQRTVSANMNSQEPPTDCDTSSVIERQSSDNSSLQDFSANDFMKSTPYIKFEENGNNNSRQPAGLIGTHKPKQASAAVNSARTLTGSQSFLGLHKSESMDAPDTQQIPTTQRNVADLRSFINQTPNNLVTTPSRDSESSTGTSKRQDDKIRKLEYEVLTLKRENQEYKQRVVTLEVKEERMREYEVKCQESEAYRQKSQVFEMECRKLQQQLQYQEQDRLLIIESYERKIVELKTQVSDFHSQIQNMKQQQQLTLNTQVSTLADEDSGDGGQLSQSQEEANEKLQAKLKKVAEERDQMRKRSEVLEMQLMQSKEQICQLVNELYSLEKEQICY